MELPEEYVNVMITYEATIGHGAYGERRVKEVVTRRAFYSKSDGYYDRDDNWIPTPEGYFSVPQYWSEWHNSDGSSSLLPYTFYQYPRVYPKDIISWRYDTNV